MARCGRGRTGGRWRRPAGNLDHLSCGEPVRVCDVVVFRENVELEPVTHVRLRDLRQRVVLLYRVAEERCPQFLLRVGLDLVQQLAGEIVGRIERRRLLQHAAGLCLVAVLQQIDGLHRHFLRLGLCLRRRQCRLWWRNGLRRRDGGRRDRLWRGRREGSDAQPAMTAAATAIQPNARFHGRYGCSCLIGKCAIDLADPSGQGGRNNTILRRDSAECQPPPVASAAGHRRNGARGRMHGPTLQTEMGAAVSPAAERRRRH